MSMKRVVITGLGAVSSLGNSVPAMIDAMETGRSGVRRMDDWSRYKGLQSILGAPAELVDVKSIPRQSRRSMGRMSIMAVQAAQQALGEAGLGHDLVASDRMGCIIGSTMGGAQALNETFETMLPDHDLSQLTSMKFFQCVSHTAAMNTAQYLGIRGYVMATSAACASSLQALGAGYDLIRLGKQDAVLCGGSEELHPTVTASFDILFATSTHFNDDPDNAPRPFDALRDGIVCGEGAGVIVLEEYEHARARGAHMYGEIIGYNTCGSGDHVSQSNQAAMEQCLCAALDEANVRPGEVDYISAHATATVQGDVEEARAIARVFGHAVPVSSLKGYLGHTLGASGSIELIAALKMQEKGLLYPTRNLKTVAGECAGIRHVREMERRDIRVIVKNCFAFGGINASLVCRRI